MTKTTMIVIVKTIPIAIAIKANLLALIEALSALAESPFAKDEST